MPQGAAGPRGLLRSCFPRGYHGSAMRKVLIVLMIVMLVGSLSGGMTIYTIKGGHHGSGSPEFHIYGGTRFHVAIWQENGIQSIFSFLVAVIDFPLCLVADTLILPLSIPWTLLNPGPENIEDNEDHE